MTWQKFVMSTITKNIVDLDVFKSLPKNKQYTPSQYLFIFTIQSKNVKLHWNVKLCQISNNILIKQDVNILVYELLA